MIKYVIEYERPNGKIVHATYTHEQGWRSEDKTFEIVTRGAFKTIFEKGGGSPRDPTYRPVLILCRKLGAKLIYRAPSPEPPDDPDILY